jgi:hypothetical protein
MKMERGKLAGLFRSIAREIETGDSFEGNISYTCMQDGLKPMEFEVKAFIRTGNSLGQGGCILIEATEAPNGDDSHEHPTQ